ncbi:MAG: DUF1643 domain-containing protein [Planktomarina sp.]|nr:DUF1643 domain-containing protein [Planktomarina sp.]MDT2032969.1 DUF1643 domain-containing protein [Planktomarina sp.]MDT2040006.1 DUF1643 domain-containing protein [Planktomarina sp.]MDT2049538.1 DUF1643 domain-containing protein [Planktomarina sp.]
MITRSHTKGDTNSIAIYSDCERYRYALTRVWKFEASRLVFVMLNPSTATEVQNDPTVERCERRARTLGFGSLQVTNIFAWRDTDPKKMRTAKDPIGPDNDKTIMEACSWGDQIIAAWGTHGAHLGRGVQVKQILRSSDKPVFHLGISKGGHPKHPLYIAYSQKPEIWA